MSPPLAKSRCLTAPRPHYAPMAKKAKVASRKKEAAPAVVDDGDVYVVVGEDGRAIYHVTDGVSKPTAVFLASGLVKPATIEKKSSYDERRAAEREQRLQELAESNAARVAHLQGKNAEAPAVQEPVAA